MTPKAKRIGERITGRCLFGPVADMRDIALGIGCIQIYCRRQQATPQGLKSNDGFYAASRPKTDALSWTLWR